MGGKGEGSGGKGGGKWGERGRELGMGYPPVHPLMYMSELTRYLHICEEHEHYGQIQEIPSGGSLQLLSCHQRISQRVVRTSLEKQLDPRGPYQYL